MTSNVKIIGLHIPKCAGTTLLDRVAQKLPPDQIYQTTSLIRNYHEGRDEITQIRKPGRLRFVFGHTIHEEMLKLLGPNIRAITGLREPTERFISDIKYQIRLRAKQGNSPLDIEQFISSTRNPMCWYLINRFPSLSGSGTPADRALRILKAFNYCYFTSNFEETSQAIFNVLEICPDPINSNVAPKDDLEIDLSKATLQWDIELYEKARAHFLSMDAHQALMAPKPEIVELASSPLDLQKLRSFLYAGTFGEYTSWRKLDEIILEKIELINEISSEIQFYMNKMKVK
ncbi:hypothetical protein DFR35_0150 [Sulfurisoma sediminicola]|uniref:Sulfotransferase family protein n=2 Tax=Sulfurisoma sediminicola TaxID=1381557 RepID=A0A497XIA4_9PROT|nr:hypothetical protein DFR35_0150 [Sulfurisoma sediminicola]